jgi:hypothetical protein
MKYGMEEHMKQGRGNKYTVHLTLPKTRLIILGIADFLTLFIIWYSEIIQRFEN